MDNLYNKFRFRNRDLYQRYSENIVRAVFDDITFFVNELGLDEFTNGDLIFFLKFSIEERGLVIPDIEKLAFPVISFVCDEEGLIKNHYDFYDDILNVVAEVVPRHISDSAKFIEPLARRITDEFKNGDSSMTMEELALKLKDYPELRFLPLSLLNDAAISVYDFFMERDEE